ncbi:hypothetical protein HAX54_018732 [Datura stramonium]|uniref:Uncharacterized protein n=1 Tax=Datura stramonium TaxID=4076 RepID=A0ABS8UMV3_DATST|nr:hypothetical protein [Datura stramonium]
MFGILRIDISVSQGMTLMLLSHAGTQWPSSYLASNSPSSNEIEKESHIDSSSLVPTILSMFVLCYFLQDDCNSVEGFVHEASTYNVVGNRLGQGI